MGLPGKAIPRHPSVHPPNPPPPSPRHVQGQVQECRPLQGQLQDQPRCSHHTRESAGRWFPLSDGTSNGLSEGKLALAPLWPSGKKEVNTMSEAGIVKVSLRAPPGHVRTVTPRSPTVTDRISRAHYVGL